MQDIFTDIYKNKRWYKGSGSGSLAENTVVYRKFLQKYLLKNNIKTVVDLGCGDWQFSKLINWSGIDYLGLDVVDFLIEDNNKNFATDHIHFKCIDGFEAPLPSADLLIIKDVLQHWPTETIKKFLINIKDRYRFTLITNTLDGKNINSDIKIGEARAIDLLREPFNIEGQEILRYQSIRKISQIMETKVVVEIKN
ncbi:MAG TPA: methyltransferase [bacterium]|nr:methyltransferase [bacterium]